MCVGKDEPGYKGRSPQEWYTSLLRDFGNRFKSERNYGIGGWYSTYFLREKMEGPYKGLQSLEQLIEVFNLRNPHHGERFRSCGRFVVNEVGALYSLYTEVQRLRSEGHRIELEYYYPIGGGCFIAGVAINGQRRHETDSDTPYQGTLGLHSVEEGSLPPNGREALLELEALNWGAFFRALPFNHRLKIITRPCELSVEQKFQLLCMFLETFGPGWNFEALERFDETSREMRIVLDRISNEVVAACVADSDEHTVEFTYWVARTDPAWQGASVMAAEAIIMASLDRWPEKTLYGEFRTTSGAVKQAMRLGFSLPAQLEDLPNESLLKGNVRVQNSLTDFTALCFSYERGNPCNGDHEFGEWTRLSKVVETPFGAVAKKFSC